MTIDISDYAIDFVRIKVPFDVDGKLAAQGYYERIIREGCDKYGWKYDCYDFGQYKDNAIKQFVPYIDCWGKPANYLYEQLSAFELTQCTRLDIRRWLDDEFINFSLMHTFALNHNHARGTTRRIDSPYRNKKGGRDVGGTSIILGGEDSDKRLCTYRRGKEAAAHELQIKGRPLYDLVKQGLHMEIEEFEAPRDNVKLVLIEELLSFTKEKYGITLEEIEKGCYPVQIVVEGPLVEETLAQIDWLFDTLPEQAQESFLEVHKPESWYTENQKATEEDTDYLVRVAQGLSDLPADDPYWIEFRKAITL